MLKLYNKFKNIYYFLYVLGNSIYIKISPHISTYLHTSPHISTNLHKSPHVSTHFHKSPYIPQSNICSKILRI